jgi:hypothetical protein
LVVARLAPHEQAQPGVLVQHAARGWRTVCHRPVAKYTRASTTSVPKVTDATTIKTAIIRGSDGVSGGPSSSKNPPLRTLLAGGFC